MKLQQADLFNTVKYCILLYIWLKPFLIELCYGQLFRTIVCLYAGDFCLFAIFHPTPLYNVLN